VFPSTGGGVWGRGSAPSPENFFDILESKWRIFVDSLVLNCAFLYDQNSKKYTRNAWSAMDIDLHAIKSTVYCYLLLHRRSKELESRGEVALKGQKLRPKAESRSGLLGVGRASPGRNIRSKRFLDMLSP